MNTHARETVAGLILAAGASTRMGKPKQLLNLGDVSLIDHVLREALNSELDLIVLVLGHQAEEIRKALKIDLSNQKLRIIENSHYRRGISSSIKAGLSDVEDRYDHCMVILADMPYITSKLINHLMVKYLTSGLPLGAIKRREIRSHPVIFGRSLYHELYLLRGDTGARSLFLRDPDKICLVEPEYDYDDMDIDTPEDYLEFKKSRIKKS